LLGFKKECSASSFMLRYTCSRAESSYFAGHSFAMVHQGVDQSRSSKLD